MSGKDSPAETPADLLCGGLRGAVDKSRQPPLAVTGGGHASVPPDVLGPSTLPVSLPPWLYQVRTQDATPAEPLQMLGIRQRARLDSNQ